MPKHLEPNARLEIVLDGDADKPPEKRPTFIYRALNFRQWSELVVLAEKLGEKGGSTDEQLGRVILAARTGLVDWKNMIDPESGGTIPFHSPDLNGLVDHGEALELISALIASGTTTRADRKNSDSPPCSGAENSASTAVPETANA